MDYIVTGLVIFIIVFLGNYLFTYYLNRKNEDIGKIKSYRYIVNRYKLKIDQKKRNSLVKYIIVINSIIITIPATIVVLLQTNYIITMVISFFVFIFLMLISYNLLGKHLKKKGW